MPTIRTRADACPGVLSPHPAVDGVLARVRLPGGVLTASALRAVAGLAVDAGDGAVHLTSRGNLQLRALDPADPRPVDRLLAAGLLPSTTHERVRNVLASPLSGIIGGTADVRGLAAVLDRGLCARPGLAALPGRFLFAFDDGRGDVAGERPDVCWAARRADDGELLVAGAGTGLRCRPADAPALLLAAAEAFLALRAGHSGDPAARAWRAAELPDAASRIAVALDPSAADRSAGSRHRSSERVPVDPGTAAATDRPGHHGPVGPGPGSAPPDPGRATTDGRSARLRPTDGDLVLIDSGSPAPAGRSARLRPTEGDVVLIDSEVPAAAGRAARFRPRQGENVLIDTGGETVSVGLLGGGAVGAAPVLGELSAAQLHRLADLAPDVLVTPWRTVVLPVPHDPDTVVAALREAGFVVDPDHPALRVSACAGTPGCAKSLADVRTHARELIMAGIARPVHVSGCDRRCGAPHTPHDSAVATGPETYTREESR